MNYFKKHLKGELSLPVSYWINIVLVNILFFHITEYIAIRIKHPTFIIKFTIISEIIFHFTIYFWQIIGACRCCKRFINNGNNFGKSSMGLITYEINCPNPKPFAKNWSNKVWSYIKTQIETNIISLIENLKESMLKQLKQVMTIGNIITENKIISG